MLNTDSYTRELVNPIRTGLMTEAKSGPFCCNATEPQSLIS